MCNPLLLELCDDIQRRRQADWSQLAIEDVCLDSLFTSVRLTDGSQGVAMNYDLEGSHSITVAQVDETRRRLLQRVKTEPLLWDFLRQPSESLGQQALLVALLSALSAKALVDPQQLQEWGWRSTSGRVPLASFREFGVKKVTVVGFGGFLEEALRQDWLEQVACLDFLSNSEDFRRLNPYPFQIYEEAKQRMNVIYDDGPRGPELMEQSDLLCISASTLCNGSLASLLPQPSSNRIVILEGPSGGVLPGPLFQRGVTHLVHNPVDVDFVHLSHRFSRQTRLGLQRIGSGRFIDILLPEQRTLQATTNLEMVVLD